MTDDEPAYRPGELLDAEALRARLVTAANTDGPLVVAVDGRSAAGKSTAAAALVAGAERWAAVHTDDVAWWHSFFDWTDLLVDGVLRPFRAGEPVSFCPPAWTERGRAGAVEVPAGTEVLVVEGVGASRLALRPWLDVAVWVHSPWSQIVAREEVRERAGESTVDLQRDWMGAELPFLAEDRPWSRADVVLDGARPPSDGLQVLQAP